MAQVRLGTLVRGRQLFATLPAIFPIRPSSVSPNFRRDSLLCLAAPCSASLCHILHHCASPCLAAPHPCLPLPCSALLRLASPHSHWRVFDNLHILRGGLHILHIIMFHVIIILRCEKPYNIITSSHLMPSVCTVMFSSGDLMMMNVLSI